MPNWLPTRKRNLSPDHALAPKKTKIFPRGIKVFYDAPNPDVDVVFIHGLTGDRDRTWTAHGTTVPWPQELLPDHLPNVRALSFGYDAYLTDWKHMVSKQRLSSHASDLLHELAAYRSTVKTGRQRPLIFVAHSLGGLVVKDMLLTAWKIQEERLRDVWKSTRAIAFLGTPHAGSGLARLVEPLARVLEIFRETNMDILSLLRSDSEVLSRVHDDFMRVIVYSRDDNEKKHQIAITCFYEALPMPVIGFIVPKESATISGNNYVSIHANHREMPRFATADDPGFQSIIGQLRAWIAEIVQSQNKENVPFVREEYECLQSLAFPEMDNRRLVIEDAAEETCGWLFEHPTYLQWCRQNVCSERTSHDSSQSLLWVKGKPGSGKSTIMKHLVDRIGADQGGNSTSLAFYFSARGVEMERSRYGMYRSLTHQLVSDDRKALYALISMMKEKKERFGREEIDWHVEELQQFLHRAIARRGSRPIRVFVDALDECNDEDVRKVVAAFERSATAAITNGVDLKICWSSRHYPHIKLKPCLELCMEHQNMADIIRYVHNTLRDWESNDSCFDLEQAIVSKARGVFLWVILVMKKLWAAPEYEQTLKQKMVILETIPSELDGLFSVILGIVNGKQREETLLFFQWVLLAARPLTLDEFELAIAFSSDPPHHLTGMSHTTLLVCWLMKVNRQFQYQKILNEQICSAVPITYRATLEKDECLSGDQRQLIINMRIRKLVLRIDTKRI